MKLIEKFFKNNTPRRVRTFLFNSIILFLGWLVLFQIENPFSNWMNNSIINHIFFAMEKLISLLGFDVLKTTNMIIGIQGSSGVQIGIPCNGISLLAVFVSYIIAFPVRFDKKVMVLLFGIGLIHLLNILRIFILILLAYYHPDWLQFNHDYTFTLIIYAITFAIWVTWTRKIKDTQK